jgi:ribosomal protein L7/L12
MIPAMNAQQRERIDEALTAGQMIQAIKLYREFTGVGLKEAKDAIDAWQSGNPAEATSAPAPRGIRPETEREFKRLLEEGKKIEAIRRFRQETGLGLKESKDAIEALEREMPGLPKKAGCMGVLMILAGAILTVWLLT